MAGAGSNSSVALTENLCEWDEILIGKDIVTRDQCLVAKGFTLDDIAGMKADAAAKAALAAVEHINAEAADALRERGVEGALADRTLGELDALEAEDGAGGYGDESALQDIRAKRVAEMRARARLERFGDVRHIGKPEWVAEVSEASKQCAVVVLMFEDAVPACAVLGAALQAVAARFPAVKCVRTRASAAVDRWPTKNVPTLFVYRHGELSTQLVGEKACFGLGVRDVDLEWWLAAQGVVDSELEGPPVRRRKVERVGRRRRGFFDDDGSEDDDADLELDLGDGAVDGEDEL